MDDTEDHIALAAEYALGTLDAAERAQVEAMMALDKEFAAIVNAWEFRLGVLNQMVGSVEPRPVVWENIKSAIAQQKAVASQEVPVLPEAQPTEEPPVSGPPVSEPAAAEPSPPERPAEPQVAPDAAPQFVPHVLVRDFHVPQAQIVDHANIIRLESRVKRWRNIASAAGALAAALVVMLALQVLAPDTLPGALRPKPRIQTVEVKTPAPALAPSAQYVALLQGAGGGPAFILTVDGATRNFTVRKVGANPEPGKSFELWLISDKLPRPRSLGVIGSGDFTTRPALAAYDSEVVNAATFAVTVEQTGGSPTGQPTSAPVFTGKLLETVPPPAPANK
jgi:anti-sigma-K factor RskA